MKTKDVPAILFCAAGAMILGWSTPCRASLVSAPWSRQPTAQTAPARRIGAIKSINGATITLTSDSGSELSVTVQGTTRVVRVAPGEKNLKNAVPIQLQDLQVGDRILAAGTATSDDKSLAASSIVVMKLSDVEARKEQDRQDWQKRGVGGLVSAVDAATGMVTISVTGFAGTKSVAIHAAKDTVIRRYSPDSVKFDDAKPSTLGEIHGGDQLRARGDRSPDGSQLAAVEIVTGSFRNIAGTVSSVDAGGSSISVQDLLSRSTVVVKVTTESQLRRLPAEMAQHIAMRLRGGAAGGSAAAGATTPNSGSGQTPRPAGSLASMAPGGAGPGGSMGSGRSGPPDFQQILNRMPALPLTDLHKGDAVLIVSTEGAPPAGGTVITLVSGVEPILQAAPTAAQAMMLAPWSLSAPSGDAGSQ